MSLSIVRADPTSVEIGLGVDIDLPVVAVLGIDNGHIVGTGGLAWGAGRCWIFFKMVSSKPEYAVPIVRATRQMLRRAVQLGETEVFTPRDAEEPASEKLLTLLGFEFDTMQDGIEIWKWVADVRS